MQASGGELVVYFNRSCVLINKDFKRISDGEHQLEVTSFPVLLFLKQRPKHPLHQGGVLPQV